MEASRRTFGKDARPARRARPPAAARSALDASRTPPRPGCPPGGADAVAARGAGRDPRPRASAATGEFARRGAARAADGPDYRLIPAAPDGAGCGDPTVRVLLSPVASRVRAGSGRKRTYGYAPPGTVEVRVLTKTYQWLWLMRLCVTH